MHGFLTGLDAIPRSGYFLDHDLFDSGAVAGQIISQISRLPASSEVVVRLVAASASVPSLRQATDTQPGALGAIREQLRQLAWDMRTLAGTPTIFGKTLTFFSVELDDGQSLQADDRLANRFPAWSGASHVTLKLSTRDGLVDNAGTLMWGGWLVAVASSILRRQQVSSRQAVEAITNALGEEPLVGHTLKAFASPTWRTSSADLMPAQNPGAGNDLHFHELLAEAEARKRLASLGAYAGQRLLVTDVHGLFSGDPQAPPGGEAWVGIESLVRRALRMQADGTGAIHDLRAAFRARLAAALRLRKTLAAIAATPGVGDCFYMRGDGVVLLMHEGATWNPENGRAFMARKNVLPFGVGEAKIRPEDTLETAVARAECALAITKVAPADSIDRFFYSFGTEPTGRLRQRLLALSRGIATDDVSLDTKQREAIIPYVKEWSNWMQKPSRSF